MNSSRVIGLILLSAFIRVIDACHNAYHTAASSNPDGTRKRRGLPSTSSPPPIITGSGTVPEADTNITIQDFFPSCLAGELAEDATYGNRTWVGPINYIIFHSRWYNRINESACAGENDTVECWAENVGTFIRRRSPALRAAQECIIKYYETYNGVNYELQEYPNGTDFEDSPNCTTVDVGEYETEFLEGFNQDELEVEDQLLTDFDDFVEFAISDMVCTDCTCEDALEHNDEYFEYFDYDGEIDCGDCWVSRIATETLAGTPIRNEMERLALKKGNLQQKTICPRIEVNYDDEESVIDLLGINVTCGVRNVDVRMEACAFVSLGYKSAMEIFIGDPTEDNSADIGSECVPRLKRRDGPDDRVVFFVFEKTGCNPYVQDNGTHTRYIYAVRNRDAEDPYSVEGVINRQIEMYVNVTCVYSNYQLSLPFGVQTLTKVISINLPEDNSEMELTMGAFQDSNFSQPFFAGNASITIPEPIWIKLSHNLGTGITLQAKECWVTPTTDPSDETRVNLILDGCPVLQNGIAAVMNFTTCVSDEVSFGFKSFSFIQPPAASLYVHCLVEVYVSTDPPCSHLNCEENSRRRRSAIKHQKSSRLVLEIETNKRSCVQASCDCEQICLSCNVAGNHECACLHGYRLDKNKKNCREIF